MKNRQRFYTKACEVDDNAVARIIQKAIEIEQQIGTISRIVFVAHGLQNDGWLERRYGSDYVKKLIKGAELPNSKIPAKFESLKTYQKTNNEILITLGLESDEILILDDNYGFNDINSIIALPWPQHSVDKWARITNAVNIDDNLQADSFPNPPCIVTKALEELTEHINLLTGIRQPNDNERAKTYLRALQKHQIPLPEIEIES